MASSMAWRSDISFSGRLTNVMKISSTFQEVHQNPSATPAEAHGEATRVETTAFNEASSLAEYQELCDKFVEALKQDRLIESREGSQELELPGSEAKVDIGKYKEASYYANGLFSTIYRARAPDIRSSSTDEAYTPGALVALKLTMPSVMGPPHDSLREARILKEARSSNVIPLWESFSQAGGQFILVLPFVRYDLQRLLSQQKLSTERARPILQDLFKALSHIHSLGIIHRDVKPSNVLVESLDGPAYLSDFGIAWLERDVASEAPTNKITDVGTTSYRPPELLFGDKAYGTAVDLWAAGCVVAEAVNQSSEPLFESGELGSELTLIHSIFKSLGTPNLDVWPEAAKFPDWGKMQFVEYKPKSWLDILPKASDADRKIVSQLVRYESSQRLKAEDVIPLLAAQNDSGV